MDDAFGDASTAPADVERATVFAAKESRGCDDPRHGSVAEALVRLDCRVPQGPRVSIVRLGLPATGDRSGDSIF